MTRRMLTGSAAAALLLACGSLATLSAAFPPPGQGGEADPSDPYANLPASITLTGVVRDFRARNTAGGHPDFELSPTAGNGHYVGIVQDELDSQGKPVFASTGYKCTSQWRDAQNRNICPPKPYIASRAGDHAGARQTNEGGAVTSAASFSSWFAATPPPGITMVDQQFPITLQRTPNTNNYVYEDRLDTNATSLFGYFDVNGRGNSNAQGGNQNFNFTYELSTTFRYKAGGNQMFKFAGDDDVWVFIDGKLVVDIGGVHNVVEQVIELDRLEWLVDGQEYPLKFFYAERDHPSSLFRFETTISWRPPICRRCPAWRTDPGGRSRSGAPSHDPIAPRVQPDARGDVLPGGP